MGIEESIVERDSHFRHSALRERIVEHIFVGDVLKYLWQRGIVDVEVLRSEFDAGGYDIVLSHERVTRHIQLKASRSGGSTSSVNVSLNLSKKPSGCVIWLVVSDDLDFQQFRWFGAPPGLPLPPIHHLRVAKHPKANAEGVKADRANLRKMPSGMFERVGTLGELLERLFGHEVFDRA